MCCRLHESNVPLSEEVVDELDAELEPFCYTAGLRFEGSDEKTGYWRNFFIGVVGDVDAQEEDNLWPNQVPVPCLQGLVLSSCCLPAACLIMLTA